MKTAHYYLLYDDECRLCRWYTGLFVQHRFLNSEELIPFQRALGDKRFLFDTKRATSEIALVSDTQEKVRYGLDSLLFVIGRKWPRMERIGRFLPLYFFFTLLYKLISFNRKIIMPSACNGACSCDPPLHRTWRFVFIVLVLWGAASVLHAVFRLPILGLFAVLSGLLIQQALLFLVAGRKEYWNYAGFLALQLLTYSFWTMLTLWLMSLMAFGMWILFIAPVLLLGLLFVFLYQHASRLDKWGMSPTYALAVAGYIIVVVLTFLYR